MAFPALQSMSLWNGKGGGTRQGDTARGPGKGEQEGRRGPAEEEQVRSQPSD